MNEIIVTHVEPGETLSDIAARYGVSVEALQQWNGIENPDLLLVGQRIVVHKGDAAEALASEGAVAWTAHVSDVVAEYWDILIGGAVILALLLLLFRRRRSPATTAQRASEVPPAKKNMNEARSAPEGASGSVENNSDATATTDRQSSASSSKADHEKAQIIWQRTCQYLQRCVEAEAANSLAPFVKKNEMWFPHSGSEELVTGKNDVAPVPPALPGKLGPRTRSIIYGWPTVVIKDRDHTPKVAPLFVLPIKPERDRRSEWVLHATGEPEFNLAITASGLFDPSVAEDIHDLLSHGLPFGDAEAFAALSGQTAKLLGLPIRSPLKTESLDTDLNREQGIYNVSISVLSGWFGFTSTLLEELRQLQTCKDWAETAAAQLFLEGFAHGQTRRRISLPLAAPLACNHSQEKALERIRTHPLSVVTGPPGTGKTQLVVNAVTNAWLDGDRVLVASTNNAAVDVAVNRAETDVSAGLLMRTGNRDAREAVPSRISVAKAQAIEHRGDQARMRARLNVVATERTRLLEELARLDELDLQLLELIDEREKLRKERQGVATSLWPDGQPRALPIRSSEIQRLARVLPRTFWFRRFRIQHLLKRLGCLPRTPLAHLGAWAKLNDRIAALSLRLRTARSEREQIKRNAGDPSTSLLETDRKWKEASSQAIRVDVAARINSGGQHLDALGNIPPQGNRFKRNISNSFNHLRGWACTALTAYSNFPLESGLFDLVIVDEASQCSLAAVLPLAYRAKRLAIVGDPFQLNPIISLSDGLLKTIAAQSELDKQRFA